MDTIDYPDLVMLYNLLHPPAVSKLGTVCMTTLDNSRNDLDEKVRLDDDSIFSM